MRGQRGDTTCSSLYNRLETQDGSMPILSSPVAAGGKHELWHGGPEDLVGLVNSWRVRVGERRWWDTRLGLMVVGRKWEGSLP